MRFLKSERGVELGRAVDRPTNLSSRATVEVSRRESFNVTSSGSSTYAQDDGARFGNVGRNLATTTNAIPIAIRKKEKNCPRVKMPMSGASGSRKYSQMMRKIA